MMNNIPLHAIDSIKDFSFRGYRIPEYMHEGILKYIYNHIPAGLFLEMVFSNDLVGAIGAADDSNIENIPAYAAYLYNYAPTGCWGSNDKYNKWVGKND